MSATRCEKRQVEMVSSSCGSSGDIVATMTVLQLPPSESRSTEVSIELRYGMCERDDVSFSCSAVITISRKCKLWLMFRACGRDGGASAPSTHRRERRAGRTRAGLP